MNRTLLKVQVAVLAVGTGFSWITLVFDYRRFLASGGHVLNISACTVTNPAITPCFYGALAFLAAFVWALSILRSAPKAALKRQRGLRFLLAAGTVFAWGNFTYEIYLFMQSQPAASAFSCPAGAAAVNPLMTPCFYGALIFLTALVVSVVIIRAHR
ncbi:MAG: hypothetical protein ACLQHK_10565 [Gallionellaceae bacterium]